MTTWQQFLDRPAHAHKYDFGHVLVVGGSPGMMGAPLLAAMAALRMGAGLVTIASLSGVVDKLESRVLEIMTEPIANMSPAAAGRLVKFVRERHVRVVVLGPGQSPEWHAFDRDILRELDIPVVIDGGGIGAFEGRLHDLSKVAETKAIILTPHTGEMARLTGTALTDSLELRTAVARSFVKEHHVTLVLKGHATVVAAEHHEPYHNDTGNSGMATAGSGDVLSGIIGALLAQGLPPKEAAERGVHVHGMAGDIAAEQYTQPGMIASDIISCLPEALRREV
jgi:NAD(P)H-hydrate epimerase